MAVPQKSLVWALVTVVVLLATSVRAGEEGGDHVLGEARTDTNVSTIREGIQSCRDISVPLPVLWFCPPKMFTF